MELQKRKVLIFVLLSLFICLTASGLSLAVDNEECLDCHGDPDFSVELPDGKTRSLYVDPKKFKVSVHGSNDVACTDCHTDLTELNYDNEVPHHTPAAFVNCGDCHDEEQSAYERSVHANARSAGKKGAPICYNCHNYHYTKHLAAHTVVERENEFCLRCHDPYKYHNWLPQKNTHFNYVECSVCHAPETGRHVHLRLYDLMTEKFLSGPEILQKLGVDYDTFLKKFDKNGDGKIDYSEFGDIVDALRMKRIRAVFWGELAVELDPKLHSVTKGKAIKNCETCHSINSPFFKDVRLLFTKPDGSVDFVPVTRNVLESFHVTHFYVLDATRVRILDIIGILIVLGGMAFAGGHMTLRILTIPLRRKKR